MEFLESIEMEPKQNNLDLSELLKKQIDSGGAPEATKIHVVDGEVTLEELYKQLLLHEDIFVEVGGESVHRIRKGISSIKAKNNDKLKRADLPIDRFKIDYEIVKEDKEAKLVRLRIRIIKPVLIQVKKIEVADKELS